MVTKRKNHQYVYVGESFREQGKPKTRIVERLGRLEDLLAKDPKGLEKLRAKYEEPRVQKMQREHARAEAIVNCLEALKIQQGSSANHPIINYGFLVLRRIWNSVLRMNIKLTRLDGSEKRKFDISDAVSFLVFKKVIDPSSIQNSWFGRLSCMGSKVEDITLADFYRTYDFLSDNKDKIMSWFNKKVDTELNISRSTMLFYDVTNIYVETSLTDEEKKYFRENSDKNIKIIIDECIQNNEITDINFNDKGQLIYESLSKDVIKKIRAASFLRMRGFSKEHRFDLPLVSVALVIDKNAIPIDFEIYSGCTSELISMESSIKSMLKKYKVQDAVVVADRGLNSVHNVNMLLDHNLGFLVAQKVSNLDSATKKIMLNQDGYACLKNTEEGVFKYKVLNNWEKHGVHGEKVTCTLMFTYDDKRRIKDEHALDEDIKKAKEAIKKSIEICGASRSWTNLVKTTGKKRYASQYNAHAEEKRRELCGYAGIIYRSSPNSKSELSDEDIITSYHSLVRIEDCFRVMKTNISLRPMFVYTEKHIRAHILCCILALALLRLIEIRLKKCGTPIPINRIIKALKNANLFTVKNSDNNLLYLKYSDYSNMPQESNFMEKNELINFLLKKYEADIDLICKSIRLTPLPNICNISDINKCFKMYLGSDNEAVGDIMFALA